MTDNRSSVMEVLDRVRRHELTPRQAEQLLAEQGQDSPIATAPPGGLPPVVWPLSLAFVWIAWRSDDVLGREWERLRFWKVTLEDEPITDRQVMTIAAARRELGNALLAGKVVAKGIEAGSSARTPIETVEWPDLTFEPGDSPNVITAGWLQPRWHDVRVSEEDVRRIWPAGAQEERTSKSGATKPVIRQSGGRVLAEHWHDMWAEVCRIVHDEGVPTDRLALVKRMQQWFVDHSMEAPASQKLNPVLDRLFKALGR